MSDETDRRIEEAAQAAKRQKETNEFMQSLTKNDELVKPVYNPEAWVIRDKLTAAAARNELPSTKCNHPLDLLRQYIDDDPSMKRAGNPVNLFECTVCHMHVWFVDPWGNPVQDS